MACWRQIKKCTRIHLVCLFYTAFVLHRHKSGRCTAVPTSVSRQSSSRILPLIIQLIIFTGGRKLILLYCTVLRELDFASNKTNVTTHNLFLLHNISETLLLVPNQFESVHAQNHRQVLLTHL